MSPSIKDNLNRESLLAQPSTLHRNIIALMSKKTIKAEVTLLSSKTMSSLFSRPFSKFHIQCEIQWPACLVDNGPPWSPIVLQDNGPPSPPIVLRNNGPPLSCETMAGPCHPLSFETMARPCHPFSCGTMVGPQPPLSSQTINRKRE